jgi:nucleoside-diphosphate-sugar epimerase
MKNKIFILGSKGFIGSNIANRLISFRNVIKLSRDNFDFLSNDFLKFMKAEVMPGDVIINVAAVAPCKNLDQLDLNMRLIINIEKSLYGKDNLRIINISSDAVYPDIDGKLSEKIPNDPTSLHGLMHNFREKLILQNHNNFLNIRPTLVYGYGDPHCGYGPNLFIKKMINKENIILFGQGEELRDHIYIEDLTYIIAECINNKLVGSLNAVTGEVISFNEIAKIIKKISKDSIDIKFKERNGPIPHNGLRSFDNSKLKKNIPQIKFKNMRDNLIQIINKYKENE